MKHWLHHLFNPHCHICEKIEQEKFDFKRDRFQASLDCRSCENLKMELARAHRLNEELIDKITQKPSVEDRPVELSDEVQRVIKTPWKVKRQLLEEADAHKARIEKELKISQVAVLTENDLDRELKELDAASKSVS